MCGIVIIKKFISKLVVFGGCECDLGSPGEQLAYGPSKRFEGPYFLWAGMVSCSFSFGGVQEPIN